ncbi:OsmC family protein [Carnobacterium pleistocenium]|uniref:OsmC family protein n=1 Tax=Carnobacterium pleistocenium TaxID=181073 RepID=UPI000551A6E0|nr:OsmC family protein [Carnobacterium pleistocenium]
MAKKIERITATSKGMQTIINSKGHEIIIDEPLQMGGKDEGANPLGAFIASLAGCENAIANMVAKEIDFDLQGIAFDIRAEMNPEGMMGNKNVRPYFQSVTINARVKTSESEERIIELQQIVDSRCPIYTTLKAADVEMTPIWTKE